jgi:hypothetical protein
MILKSKNSNLSTVNLFADFILNKIPKEEESIIQVIDCVNFMVIKGKTTYNAPLNILEIKNEFLKKFELVNSKNKINNTIDLIEYDCSITKKDDLVFTYHNTDNCSYHKKQIESFKQDEKYSYDYNFFSKKIMDEDNLVSVSEFPHGYSLNQGRLLYYYGKHIVYNIPSNVPFESLTLTLSNKKNSEGEIIFDICDNFSDSLDESLTSAILDLFDFDMSWIENEIKKVDWSLEITNPLEDYEFLKKKVKDFIII